MTVNRQAIKEFDENRHLLDSISDEIIKNRIGTSLKWYICNAVKAKHYFYLFSIITIVAPIISGILINIPLTDIYVKIISSLFAGLTSVCASTLNLFNFRKNWELYRNQAEEIKRILAENLSDPIGDKKVLKKIEKSMQTTDKSWMEMIEQQSGGGNEVHT